MPCFGGYQLEMVASLTSKKNSFCSSQGLQSSVVIQAQQVNYSPLPVPQDRSILYLIKLMPKKKSDFSVRKLRELTVIYESVEDLKKDVYSACNGKISLESFGYIEPGHGSKGKQQWLASTDDLKDMYSAHRDKKEILLWSRYSDVPRKRAHSPDPDENEKRARYDKYLDKMTDVEMIEEELVEKHLNGEYSKEQLRSWAHLIQMKKHTSYNTPPNKRFWKSARRRPLSSSEGSSSSNVSPGKKINLREQCVQQLLQLHQLLEKGGINKEQYDEMQSTIIGDVKNLTEDEYYTLIGMISIHNV